MKKFLKIQDYLWEIKEISQRDGIYFVSLKDTKYIYDIIRKVFTPEGVKAFYVPLKYTPPVIEGVYFKKGLEWSPTFEPEIIEGEVFSLDDFDPYSFINFVKVEALPQPSQDSLPIITAERITAYNKAVEEFLLQEAAKQLPVINSFVKIDEANKQPWFSALDQGDGKNYIILHRYITSCGNTSLLLHPVAEELEIPDQYKGLVIGRQGANIKALCKKYNINFKIK